MARPQRFSKASPDDEKTIVRLEDLPVLQDVGFDRLSQEYDEARQKESDAKKDKTEIGATLKDCVRKLAEADVVESGHWRVSAGQDTEYDAVDPDKLHALLLKEIDARKLKRIYKAASKTMTRSGSIRVTRIRSEG